MALIKCSECGKEISDTCDSCIHCGCPIEKTIVCSECGKEIDSDMKNCPNCGNKLTTGGEMDKSSKKSSNLTSKYYFISTVIVIVVIILIIIFSKLFSKVNFQDIYDKIGCDLTYCDVASDGSYLEIDTNPSDIEDDYSYDAMEYIQKVNAELGFTDALYSKMGKTRALDGTLEDENDKVKVSWTYHPDNGLEVIYTAK